MIKNRFDDYLLPFKNGHLTHVDSKLYTKCSFEIGTHLFRYYDGGE
jgi:hypothetical protein